MIFDGLSIASHEIGFSNRFHFVFKNVSYADLWHLFFVIFVLMLPTLT